MDSRLAFLAVGLVVGGLLGGAFVQVSQPPRTGVSVPSMTTSASTGCATGAEPRAWVGMTGTLDHRIVEFQNLSFTHDDPTLGVRGNLTEPSPGEFVLALRTVSETPTKAPSDDCQPRTTVSASVALPTDFRTLDVRLGDEHITTVENADRPRFYYVNETADA